jgi:hypothetical protein
MDREEFRDHRVQGCAIEIRHREIENEQIVRLAKDELEGVLRVRRGVDGAIGDQGLQRFTHEAQDEHVIVDDEDLALRLERHDSTTSENRSTLRAMTASNPYQTLAAALRERLAVIADRELYARDPAAHLEKLKAVSEKIDAAQLQIPLPINPELLHFLQRRSYDKALALLESQ